MVKYLQVVKEEVKDLESFEIMQVPRSENNQADALSKLASSAVGDSPRTVFWEVKEKRSIEVEGMNFIARGSTWMDEIMDYK